MGSGCSNDYYHPEIESYWRYTKGENCTNPIVLGTLSPGSAISFYHFNSNECYVNDFGTPGNDVFYQVYFPQPIGVKISLCGNTVFNSMLYLLDSTCSVIVESNDDNCANKSEIRTSICYPGKYYIVVDGVSAGDMGTFELTVMEDTSLTYTLTLDTTMVSCSGGNDGQISAIVSGGFPPYSFLWNTGATDSVLIGLTAGTYWVAVTDSKGCTLRDTVVITQPPPLDVTVNTTPSTCGGANNGMASAVVNGGTPPYSYLWQVSPPQIGNTAINLSPGTYTLIVTDNKGCIEQTTFSIGATLSIQPQITYFKDASCAGFSDGGVCLQLNGGNPPYQYWWSSGSTDSCSLNLSAGTYTFSASDVQNCTISTEITISEPPQLSLTLITVIEPKCWGDSTGVVDIYTSGGTPPYIYQWSNSSTSEDLIFVPAGIYTLTFTDANGCSLTQSFTINQPQPIVIQGIVNDVSCKGAQDGSIQTTVTGGSSPFQYLWSTQATTSSITGLSGNVYFLTVKDAKNCQKDTFFIVDEPDSLKALLISLYPPTCYGDTDAIADIQVWGGTYPYSYLWSNGSTTDDLIGVGEGTYILTVRDANNCQKTITVQISYPPEITINGQVSDVSCGGANDGQIILTVNGGVPPYQYLWSNGATTQNLNNIPGGVYLLVVTDKNGCMKYRAYYVDEPDSLLLSVVATDVRCPGGKDGSAVAVVTGGTPPYSFVWSTSPPQLTQQAIELTAGDYSVTVTDFKQCSVSGTVYIAEPLQPPEDCSIIPPYFVLIPNAFTPDNDGINDEFVVTTHGASHLSMVIFNRWGNRVFEQETNSSSISWDGTYKNSPAPEGVYVYKVVVKYNDGREITHYGKLILLR